MKRSREGGVGKVGPTPPPKKKDEIMNLQNLAFILFFWLRPDRPSFCQNKISGIPAQRNYISGSCFVKKEKTTIFAFVFFSALDEVVLCVGYSPNQVAGIKEISANHYPHALSFSPNTHTHNTHEHTNTHTHTQTHTITHTLTHTLTHIHTYTQSHIHTVTQTYTHTQSHTL